jgi:PAS domain S-box-containing protein
MNAEENNLLPLLIEQAVEYAVILCDRQSRILSWNAGAERIFRKSRDDAIGTSLSDLFTPEDRSLGLDDVELRVAQSKQLSEDDRWHLRGDGSRFWSSGALIAVRNGRGELVGYGKVLRDRTDLKEQLERLNQQLDASRRADREKEIAIAKTAHELRNLLASFSVGLDMLKGPADHPDKRLQLVQLMSDQLMLVHRLAEDLMDMERLHTGKLTLITQNVLVQDSLRTTIESLRHRLEAKRLTLECIEPQAPLWVEADPARLQQVFANLLENAIKYTPDDGRIWITLTAEDRDLVIHVQDTGIGIPPAMLSRIFDLFTQVQAASTPAQSGLGIGLALVKDLVELHGGSVQARSDGPGEGSVFTVRLPLAAPQRSLRH